MDQPNPSPTIRLRKRYSEWSPLSRKGRGLEYLQLGSLRQRIITKTVWSFGAAQEA
jgi:hypothetical protein